MSTRIEDFKKQLQAEIKNNEDTKKNYKPYMQFMDDISSWMKEWNK